MPKKVTRIISDLHYADSTSWVKNLGSLRPLFEGVDHMIVNGDAMDTQVLDDPKPVVEELKSFFAANVPRVDFITGNHDPDISELFEISLLEGLVWVTHGHVVYDSVAPWGRHAPEILRRLRTRSRHLSADEVALLENRFPLFREICLKLPKEHDPKKQGRLYGMLRMFRAVFPPNRIYKMMQVWRDMPHLAANLARQQRQNARVIVMGHTHAAGVWPQYDGRVVINTGSFCPPHGAKVVDLVDEYIVVHRVARHQGEFRLGERRAEFPVVPLSYLPAQTAPISRKS